MSEQGGRATAADSIFAIDWPAARRGYVGRGHLPALLLARRFMYAALFGFVPQVRADPVVAGLRLRPYGPCTQSGMILLPLTVGPS